jgi:hypothetical protein
VKFATEEDIALSWVWLTSKTTVMRATIVTKELSPLALSTQQPETFAQLEDIACKDHPKVRTACRERTILTKEPLQLQIVLTVMPDLIALDLLPALLPEIVMQDTTAQELHQTSFKT